MERIGLADNGYHISMSENGWTDNELGQAYFEDHFNYTKEIMKGQYRILIVDGHDCHLTIKAIQYCIDNKIILLCLPPHATHMLQPLDVGCFGPLAQVYKDDLKCLHLWRVIQHRQMRISGDLACG
jgi:hypothetical protein